MLSEDKRKKIEDKFSDMFEVVETNEEYINSLLLIAELVSYLVSDFPEDKKDGMRVAVIKNIIGGR